jgi:hypothetical protein
MMHLHAPLSLFQSLDLFWSCSDSVPTCERGRRQVPHTYQRPGERAPEGFSSSIHARRVELANKELLGNWHRQRRTDFWRFTVRVM